MGPEMGHLETNILDAKTLLTYHTEEYFGDAESLNKKLDQLRPKLETDSALEAYVQELTRKYNGRKPPKAGGPPKKK
jgi:hypothetical protein